MDIRSSLRQVAIWLFAAIGFGPLISKAIEKWAERNGYIDDPARGIHWLLGGIGSVTELWFFYPTIAFLAGTALGLWIDTTLRSLNENRSAETRTVGFELMNLGEAIDQKRRVYEPWPQNVGDLVPQLQSMFVRLHKAGYWVPSFDIMTLHDNGEMLSNYLAFVGRMLADGHQDEAEKAAQSIRSSLERQLAELRRR